MGKYHHGLLHPFTKNRSRQRRPHFVADLLNKLIRIDATPANVYAPVVAYS
jgi:hypothetical protein